MDIAKLQTMRSLQRPEFPRCHSSFRRAQGDEATFVAAEGFSKTVGALDWRVGGFRKSIIHAKYLKVLKKERKMKMMVSMFT